MKLALPLQPGSKIPYVQIQFKDSKTRACFAALMTLALWLGMTLALFGDAKWIIFLQPAYFLVLLNVLAAREQAALRTKMLPDSPASTLPPVPLTTYAGWIGLAGWLLAGTLYLYSSPRAAYGFGQASGFVLMGLGLALTIISILVGALIHHREYSRKHVAPALFGLSFAALPLFIVFRL